jgi:hypothetical protein
MFANTTRYVPEALFFAGYTINITNIGFFGTRGGLGGAQAPTLGCVGQVDKQQSYLQGSSDSIKFKTFISLA